MKPKAQPAPMEHMQIVCPKCGHNIYYNRGEKHHAGFAADSWISAVCANSECGEKFNIPIGHLRKITRVEKIDPLPF